MNNNTLFSFSELCIFVFYFPDVVLEYIISVLTDILHTQHDPLPLCLTIQLYDKEIDSSESKAKTVSVVKFYHYYSHWIPAQAKETLVGNSL